MKKLAQFGHIYPPPGVSKFQEGNITGLPLFLNVILKSLIVIASIYALFNFVIAGYSFISAGGDSKKVHDAQSKIWQTILGLFIVAGSFVIASIIGLLIFDDANAILQIRIFGPE
ncbi:hypothetical protein A2686_03345 [Candidatus Woesebacteria bacterium RIFCSPHIGHO2_01_FULL_38_10]|uniref:Uncharacterized protein n=1 Tax=Candidatus Woesebacteria bacterium RIFCSPLOWO2_01_FULL_39_10b TaxID=1802517 RepID=A0A1F8B8V1_9BACT|nr:MAG: hypothetical protein A2686_03345 [Candidatus Woesebacteria bacterium RIFCSPHIGHO2_01_FULL_38_10]OGM60360.1 MAG: hypothetical protein A2892_03415 [Candidatus Woesebacteria bacterium RIFCSPLOWO2_01_FULL_39_10b]